MLTRLDLLHRLRTSYVRAVTDLVTLVSSAWAVIVSNYLGHVVALFQLVAADQTRWPVEQTPAVPILVVDDDPETLRHLRDTLAEAGYAPLVTGDPGAVARIIRAEKPQLVLLDLMLPGTDGIELM